MVNKCCEGPKSVDGCKTCKKLLDIERRSFIPAIPTCVRSTSKELAVSGKEI